MARGALADSRGDSEAGAAEKVPSVRDLAAAMPDSKENNEPRTPASQPSSERGQPVNQAHQQAASTAQKPCMQPRRNTPTMLLSPQRPLRPSQLLDSHEIRGLLSLTGRSPVSKSQPLSPLCSRSAPSPKRCTPHGVSAAPGPARMLLPRDSIRQCKALLLPIWHPYYGDS